MIPTPLQRFAPEQLTSSAPAQAQEIERTQVFTQRNVRQRHIIDDMAPFGRDNLWSCASAVSIRLQCLLLLLLALMVYVAKSCASIVVCALRILAVRFGGEVRTIAKHDM